MHLVRLLAVGLLTASPISFAQSTAAVSASAAPIGEPKSSTSLVADSTLPPDAGNLDRTLLNFSPERTDEFVITPAGDFGADAFCFKMRSYVVARDSKHSDSTHLVGYSTCQPARRYGLKKVESEPRDLSH